ncbi:MAG: hypothetical protein A2X22_10190 [Bacteroidetes bacterium GWF2_49_14]|nr:MAG: hypothetical protein A2X22_10190 [Bacteroidetes bacterium GWF2_49_14]HBB92077.1 deoxyribonuclease HsdR [Bacteroidales bacterium]
MKAKNYLGMLLIGIAGSLIGVAVYSSLDKPKTVIVQKEAAMPVQLTGYTGGYEAPDFRLAAAKSVHAVVHVKTVTSYKQLGYESIQDRVFGNAKIINREIPGFGSGVIISEDGYIVTNNHVIENSNSIEVTLNDGRVEKAEIIGRDPQTEVALIKIKAKNLPFLTFGSSADMEVGDWVLAVGNPFDFESTVTAGIISAKGRSGIIGDRRQNPYNRKPGQGSTGIESFIQTDAVVNPGNSGGALVNLRGDLIGINTAIASQTGSYIGYSFAIPAAIAKKVVEDLKEFGKVQRVVIGITGGTVVPGLVEQENLKVNQGVYVTDLTEDGGALAAGLKSGDVIIAIDNEKVTSMADLQEEITPHRPGDKISVMVDRKGEQKTFTVTLKPQSETSITLGASQFSSYIGADFEKLTEKELTRYDITYGVRVARLGEGKLKEAGVPEGFIITDINKTIKVNEIEDIQAAIERSQDNRTILIEGVMPNGRYAYFAFRK